jgi:MtrB/PioB family decaheme-associated outer membrane protein
MLRAAAMAFTCLVPLAAYAQDDFNMTEQAPKPAAPADLGTVTIGGMVFHANIGVGIGGVFGQNPDQAGRYSGMNTDGAYGGLYHLDLTGRSAWDGQSTRYFSLTADDLMLNAGGNFSSGVGSSNGFGNGTANSLANGGSIALKVGEQGTWSFGVTYDAITYTGNVIDSIYTVTGSKATLNNNLAPWGGATSLAAGPTTSFTVAGLNATGAMLPVQVGTRRDILGANFKYQWQDWTFTGAIRHEEKNGSMEEAFDGPWGGTAFAMPINYVTDRYDLSASYNVQGFQSLLQYTFSHFVDNNLFVSLPYPTSGTATPFQRSAAYSLPPSNDAHYLTLQLADSNLIPKTRVNLNARVGVEMQNDTFAPNTADPSLNAAQLANFNSELQGTSSNSPDIVATVYQVRASAASRPIENVDTRIFYGVDGRQVTIDQYKVNTSGTGGASDSSLLSYEYVVPQDWLKQNAGGEIGYRIMPEYDTRVSLGYRFDKIDRSNAQVGHSDQSSATAAVTSNFGANLNGKLSFEFDDRTANMSYLTPWQNLAGTPTGGTYSGAYYQAPMTAEGITARLDYTPNERISGGAYLRFRNENYNYAQFTPEGTDTAASVPFTGIGQGVKQDFNLTLGPDLNYRPSKDVNIHLFYTYELLFYNNTGNGACSSTTSATTAACLGTAGYFQNKDTSSTHTVGVSADWQVSEKLKLRGDYTVSYGTVMFGEYNGVFIGNPTLSYQNVGNYPDINSLLHNVKLTATYQLQPNVDLVLQGIFVSYHNNDWADTANAVQGNGSGSISILSPGYSAPNYNVAAIMAGANFKF